VKIERFKRVMKGCSGWYMQPLSTLSASIEHPLEAGGNHVEKRENGVKE